MAENNAILVTQKTKACHVCAICNREFITKRDLLLHQYIHKEKPNFTCQICNKTFPNEASYKRHARVHNRGKKTITCKICEEVFDNGRALEDHHRQNHLNEKKFRCETCGAEFSWRDNLLKHERMHAAETHICDQCHKGFMDNTSLRVHIRNHHSNVEDPEKPYICGICNKAFKFDFSYEAHLNAHERPASSVQPKAATATRQLIITPATQSTSEPISNQAPMTQKDIEVGFKLDVPASVEENLGDEAGQDAIVSPEVHTDLELGVAQQPQETTTIVVNNGSSSAPPSQQESLASGAEKRPAGEDAPKPGTSGVSSGKKRRREAEPLMFDFVMSEEKPHQCIICGQSYRWEISLQIHMKSHEVGYVPPARGRGKSRGSLPAGQATSPGVQKTSRIVGKRNGSDSEGEGDEDFVYTEHEASVAQATGSHMIMVSVPAVTEGGAPTVHAVQTGDMTATTATTDGNIITIVSAADQIQQQAADGDMLSTVYLAPQNHNS